MNAKEQDEFYLKLGANIHRDLDRFSAIAKLCRGHVLDVGCGTGDLADCYSGKYTGVDQSIVAIEMAIEHRRDDVFFHDHDALDYLDETKVQYDTVVMAEFLEHIKDWDKFIQKVIKKIPTCTRLVISVPNGNRIPEKDHVAEFTVPQLRKHFSDYGRVKFYNWSGFVGRILMTVDIGKKNPRKLALGMFCKNEAQGIEMAVLSCIDFVDEIVILVDDKCSDKTFEIAQRYADLVQKFTWNDSFCQVRNMVQDHVISDWVLCLDGHEFVKKAPKIREKLNFNGDGLMIKVNLENNFKFDFPRIVRKSVIWDRDIHNNAQCKKVVAYSDFIIQHDREHGQAEAAIKERNEQRTILVEKEMKKEMKKNKKKSRPYFYLGELYFSEGKFKKAIKMWKKYLKYGKHKAERWLVCYNIAMACNYRMFFPFGLRWLKKAEKEYAGRWEIQKAFGFTYLCLHEYELAAQYFVDSLQETKGHFVYSPLEFNISDTWEKMGVCMRRLNNLPEALVCWKRAIKTGKLSEKTANLLQRIKILKEYIAAVEDVAPKKK